MKRKNCVFIFLSTAVGFPLFADISFGEKVMPTFRTVTKFMDVPLAHGMTDFIQIFYNLESIVISLVTILCFINIVFQCFKLWAGTIELKKVYIDIIYKCVMCILLMNLYPLIQAKTMQIATNTGAYVSGGKQKIERTFARAFVALRESITKTTRELFDTLVEKGTFTDKKTGQKYISDTIMKQLQSEYHMTQEDIYNRLVTKGIMVASAIYSTREEIEQRGAAAQAAYESLDPETKAYFRGGPQISLNSPIYDPGFVEYRDGSGKRIDMPLSEALFGSANDDKTALKTLNSSEAAKLLAKTYAKLSALSEVLTGKPIKDKALETDPSAKEGSNLANLMTSKVDQIFYTPYLIDDKGAQSNFLAPSAILKTCFLMADCIVLAAQYENPSADNKKKANATIESDTFADDTSTEQMETTAFWDSEGFFWGGLRRMIVSLVYYLGMFICAVLAIVEYTLCMWEYMIVTSLAALLIPLMFLDSVKSYAQNIIKIFLQYFAKMMVLTLAVYYVLGMYLDVATETFIQAELQSLTSMGYFAMIMLLGITFITTAEKVANILFTGTPQMSTGDIVRAAHDVAGAAHAVGGAAKLGGQAVGGIAKFGQGAVRGGMNLGAQISGAAKNFSEVNEQLKADQTSGRSGMTNGQRRATALGSALKQLGGNMGRDVQSAVHKVLTGQDKQWLDKEGNARNDVGYKVGQQIEDPRTHQIRKATMGDVMSRETKRSNENAEKSVENARKKGDNNNPTA